MVNTQSGMAVGKALSRNADELYNKPVPDSPEEQHPLDVPAKDGLQLGWIDQYADCMTRLTHSPRQFHKLGGIVVAATAIQRRGRLQMSFGDIYSNIYGAIIAPSSVYHKSSAMAKSRDILHRAGLHKLLLSELMTSEGLLKELKDRSSGLILRDEIGTLFSSHNTKYLANLKPDLTALYDGYPYSRRLSREEIRVPSPYLNILGATTPPRFFESVSRTDWQDGFLPRWLLVMPDQEPDFDSTTGLFTEEYSTRVESLAATLIHIDRQRETDFVLEPEAFALWDAWQRQAVKNAYYYGDDVTTAIVTRYAAYGLKFAMILAAVNDSWGTITADTMQTAIDLADSFKQTMYRVLSEKASYGVSGAKLQKVFGIILKHAETGIVTKAIYQAANMRQGEAQPVLEKLIEIGAVYTEQAGRGVRYFPATDRLPVRVW